MSEFSEVLRAWRDRVRPEEAGLPAGGTRRAAGLRRAELGQLAGVSVEYIIRLEQGRAKHPSPQMLGALARALRLTDEERDHFFRVAGVAAPAPGLVPQHIPRGVQRMIDRLGDAPLAVLSASWDLLQWNPLWAAVSGDPTTLRGLDRNVAWRHFMHGPGVIDFDAVHAREFSSDLAADLREAMGRYPEDRGLARLIAGLREDRPNLSHGGERLALHGIARVPRPPLRPPSDRSQSTVTCSLFRAVTCALSFTRPRRARTTRPNSSY